MAQLASAFTHEAANFERGFDAWFSPGVCALSRFYYLSDGFCVPFVLTSKFSVCV
jgi:hypothetical protein